MYIYIYRFYSKSFFYRVNRAPFKWYWFTPTIYLVYISLYTYIYNFFLALCMNFLSSYMWLFPSIHFWYRFKSLGWQTEISESMKIPRFSFNFLYQLRKLWIDSWTYKCRVQFLRVSGYSKLLDPRIFRFFTINLILRLIDIKIHIIY